MQTSGNSPALPPPDLNLPPTTLEPPMSAAEIYTTDLPIPPRLVRPDPGREQVADLLLKASRTFALTIPLLPEPLRHAMGVGYLLMRNADSIEDAWRWTREERTEHLRAFIDLLLGPYDVAAADAFVARLPDLGLLDDPGHAEVLRQTPFVVDQLVSLPFGYSSRIRKHVLRVARGMVSWVERHDDDGRLALTRLRELDDYCYAVAGIVGEMITELVEFSEPGLTDPERLALRTRAVDFGIGLQLVNVSKDSWRDAQEGRTYLPEAFLPTPEFPERIDAVLLLAASRLDRGIEFTMTLPAHSIGVRRFCLVALVLAAATLQELATRSEELAAGEDVKIDRETVGRLVSASMQAAADNDAIRNLWSSLREPLEDLHVA